MDNRILLKNFKFQDKDIPIYQCDFFTEKRHHTKRYLDAMDIIINNNVTQKPVMDTLNWYFKSFMEVPLGEKKSIQSIEVCEKSRIIALRMIGDETYNQRNYIAKVMGWYFYITGYEIPQSEVSEFSDSIKKKYDTTLFQNYVDVSATSLKPVGYEANHNSFLLNLGSCNILLDAGMSTRNFVNLETDMKIDFIFISHSHLDHYCGLFNMMNKFPDAPILISSTTLDFILIKERVNIEEPKVIHQQLIENSIIVKNLEKIYFGNQESFIQFFFAGHMPGALMFFVQTGKFKFLYTGDYTLYDYLPIPGIYSILQDIPTPLDYLLIDGCFSGSSYNAPKYQFDFLKNMANLKAIHKNDALFASDSSSIGIIIYTSLHNFFIKKKEEEKFESRPHFYLNSRIYEYAKVLCTRLDDIHPSVAMKIGLELNPFSSANIRWIYSGKEHFRLLKELTDQPDKSRFIIYDSSNLDNKNIIDYIQLIGKKEHNVIYLSGRISREGPTELVSGNDNVSLEYFDKKENVIKSIQYENKAIIQNRIDLNNILILHGDKIQLVKIIEALHPKRICFFHQQPIKLVGIRNELEKIEYIAQTDAFYYDKPKEVSFLKILK